MKPNFALQFLNDSISLLHRTARGWLEIGSTPIDAPDLADALGYLRRSALGLAPHGVATKLVIPEDQILYLHLSAPGPTDSHRDMQIRAALEGRTPYAVEDLVFDWSGEGPLVQVAVVARETLREAEAFAQEYRLNPISFVALPDPARFDGEPWFGPSDHAASLLQDGDIVERDADAVTIVSRDPQHRDTRPAVAPAPAPVADLPDAAPAATEPEPMPFAEHTTVAEPDLQADVEASVAEPIFDDVTALDPTEFEAELQGPDLPEPDPPEPPAPEPVRPEIPSPAPDPRPEPLPEIAPDLPEPEIPAEPEIQPEPGPEIEPWDEPWEGATLLPLDPVPDSKPLHELESVTEAAPSPVSVIAPTIAEDVPPPPPGPPFATRRAADALPADTTTRRLPAAPLTPPALAASAALARSYDPDAPAESELPPPVAPAFRQAMAATRAASIDTPVSRPPRGAKSSGPVTAPGITGPGVRAGRSARATKASARVDAQEVAQTLVAPPPEPASFRHARPERGRPRYLGLILTGLLLLVLAGVAAWSSITLSRNSAPAPSAVAETTPDPAAPVASAEDIPPSQEDALAEDEALADGQLPAPGAETPAAVADAVAQPEPADTAASTPLATPETQDEIIVSTQDAPPQPTDALALEATEVAADTLPGAPMPPPPFGTLYEFDADGLIKPTPDGIVTPEGVRLVAGRPDLVPPPRPESIAARAAPTQGAEPPAEGAVRVEPYTDPATQGLRPRPRPEGLSPTTAEDAAAPVEPEGPRIVSLVPRARPASVVKFAEQVRLDEEARKVAEAASLSAAAAAAALAEPPPTPPAQAALQPTGPVPGGIGISRMPPDKPRNFDRRVQAALAAALVNTAKPTQVAAAQPAPEPQKAAPQKSAASPQKAEPGADDEPEQGTVTLRGSNSGSVAKNATFANAINLGKTNLIGVYGTPSRRYALIRTGTGSYKKVRVGDSIDGGKVAAITDSEVRYQKGGRMVALSMPKG